MAVYRVEKTQNYTVMCNYHLRDKRLTLKAKGLLSLMLSLPEDWDFTTKGLAAISKDGIDCIRSTVKELESCGYVLRQRIRNDKGQMIATEYTILEQPRPASPGPDNPVLDRPTQEEPVQGNPTQLNTKKPNTEEQNTDARNIDSFPSVPASPGVNRLEGSDSSMDLDVQRILVRDQIDYPILAEEMADDLVQLDGVVEMIAELLSCNRKTIRVAGSEFPHHVVKARMYLLTADHIRYVFDCLKENTTKIRNMKQYLLTALFNAPLTMESHYAAMVNHDLYGGKR